MTADKFASPALIAGVLADEPTPQPLNSDFEDTDVVTLVDEDGVGHDFEIAEILEVEQPDQPGVFRQYALLLPYLQAGQEPAEDEEVLVMRFVADNDEMPFEFIDDDAEFEAVVAVLEQSPDYKKAE